MMVQPCTGTIQVRTAGSVRGWRSADVRRCDWRIPLSGSHVRWRERWSGIVNRLRTVVPVWTPSSTVLARLMPTMAMHHMIRIGLGQPKFGALRNTHKEDLNNGV